MWGEAAQQKKAPVRRVRADSFLRQWCLHHRAIDALPSPRDALHVVVFRQAGFPDRFKETRLLSVMYITPHFSTAGVEPTRTRSSLPLHCLQQLEAGIDDDLDPLGHQIGNGIRVLEFWQNKCQVRPVI
jgi:hypothetical protein